MGRPRIRLVTIWSIRSEVDIFLPDFFTVLRISLVMYSYRSLVMMLSMSSSWAFSSCLATLSTLLFTPASRVSWASTLLSLSRSLTAYHLLCTSGTPAGRQFSTSPMAASTSSANRFSGACSWLVLASFTAFSTTSFRPVLLRAEVSTISQPRAAPSFLASIRSPVFFNRSLMFRAITTGIPTSSTWVVRYRFLSMLVASTRLMMASGFSFNR